MTKPAARASHVVCMPLRCPLASQARALVGSKEWHHLPNI
jgi:hypothetical protein